MKENQTLSLLMKWELLEQVEELFGCIFCLGPVINQHISFEWDVQRILGT